ncbi:MAG: type II toxin-antitoxin system VapB family antitoxin [Acidobacteriaceae bacterium]|jgi:antitoxin VapB|nr:type II toxin-antitoxin system VapB family antitoxin [Acidobacteriaceae bacterium]
MALSIKTAEADRLARELSRMTGENMTDAITRAMRERVDRLHAEREAHGGYAARVRAFVRHSAALFDRRPVTQDEWDEAAGDLPVPIGRGR